LPDLVFECESWDINVKRDIAKFHRQSLHVSYDNTNKKKIRESLALFLKSDLDKSESLLEHLGIGQKKVILHVLLAVGLFREASFIFKGVADFIKPKETVSDHLVLKSWQSVTFGLLSQPIHDEIDSFDYFFDTVLEKKPELLNHIKELLVYVEKENKFPFVHANIPDSCGLGKVSNWLHETIFLGLKKSLEAGYSMEFAKIICADFFQDESTHVKWVGHILVRRWLLERNLLGGSSFQKTLPLSSSLDKNIKKYGPGLAKKSNATISPTEPLTEMPTEIALDTTFIRDTPKPKRRL